MTQPPENPVHSGLVSVDELRNYMKTSFTESERNTAAMILIGVQQELETYLNRPVELVQIREILVSDRNGYINPSITPIHKVIKCESIETMVSPFSADYSGYVPGVFERDPLIDPDNGRMLDRLYPTVGDPLIISNGIFTNVPSTPYAVEYVAGYNGYVNQALKMDIIRVASREMSKNHSMSLNLRDGQAQTANEPDPRPRGWSEEELVSWDRLRRRTIA